MRARRTFERRRGRARDSKLFVAELASRRASERERAARRRRRRVGAAVARRRVQIRGAREVDAGRLLRARRERARGGGRSIARRRHDGASAGKFTAVDARRGVRENARRNRSRRQVRDSFRERTHRFDERRARAR